MVTYVDTQDQLSKFLEEYNNQESIIISILSDSNKHPANNSISILYFYLIDSKSEFCLLINHYERIFKVDDLVSLLNNDKIKYVLNKKEFLHVLALDNVCDISLLRYLNNIEQGDETNATQLHKQYQVIGFDIDNIFNYISSVKLLEICNSQKDKILSTLNRIKTTDSKEYDFYNKKAINALYNIELNGIATDSNQMLYTQYNFYTLTGRPSNKFGGINFAALPKDSNVRQSIVSRYNNGYLIEIDYVAYHLSLLATLVGYNYGRENMHYHIGRQYYKDDILTKEQYTEIKSLNFKYLYGGIPDDISNNIKYFRLIKEYYELLWELINEVGYLESPISNRKIWLSNIENPNPPKVLNYYIQLIEFETNVDIINRLHIYLNNSDIKLILYTYDSFLFDCPNFMGNEKIINDIKEIRQIIENDIFMSNTNIGYTYNDMRIVGDKK